MSLIVFLVLLMGLVAMPAEAQVQRVIFASAGFDETNRFWVLSRPNQLQNDPYLETLLDLDPTTGAFIPRLAEKWEASPDMTEWTVFLRKGVPFHFGYGEFTARDVVHSHALMLREEAVATFVGIWRNVVEVKVINDYQVVFRMKGPTTTLPYALSRSGDLRMVSKAQWDKEGLEGFEKRPAGTGSYQYVSRHLGQSIVFERVEHHWSGIRPAFKELEIRIAPEESTRLAMLLNGEAHIVDLARELQGDAEQRGMQILAASLASRARAKDTTCCLWPNLISLRPTEEMLRVAHTSGALAHLFESAFLEQKYVELTKTLDPQARERVARAMTDYLFDEFTSIPLITVFHEVAVNPKVIAGWTWPGQGAGRTTHFDLIKAAP